MIEIRLAIRKSGIADGCTCCAKSTQANKRIIFMDDEHILGTSVVLRPSCFVELFEK